ncbi:hypothetical protein M378DRAFT_18239 [Amanita muscaria Koide BX008]|uniref:Uncharacterized protein n=1 Tax=Amanita muscaria (strain Koide BX008) TaxID=946122 RepID=A0A0C2WG92_AMAMK|nr:hypothetical protein M378DRAFT_18239 [Amanita muscaria Koide BX008]
MRKHAKRCWGDDAVRLANEASGCDVAHKSVVQPLLRDGTITASFERKKGKVTYMHQQHTKTETRAEMVRWVSESLHPFSIIRDRSFNNLMKTGRPEYYIPLPQTVSRDVRLVFKRTRERIAKMLQEYEGCLSFATDAWTSPNHRAIIAITVHFQHNGMPLSTLLDIVEVPQSHTGVYLAQGFVKVLEDFGISEKACQHLLSVTADV